MVRQDHSHEPSKEYHMIELQQDFDIPQPQWTHVKTGGAIKRPYEADKQLSPVPKQRARQEIAPAYRSANFVSTQSNRSTAELSTSVKPTDLNDLPILTKESTLPFYEPTKCSSGRNGIIKAYAANTNQGIVRDYNEDRVSIILNIVKPQSRSNETWPKCSFFGVYDGHGGSACADFLRDNLHQFVIREPEFPLNPHEALRRGFEAAEKHFLDAALQSYARGQAERSGSCAIVALFVGDTCYVANVGDSRAVLSATNGRQVFALSRDHKPCDELEQLRIQQAGGKIYQTQACTGPDDEKQVVMGPLRVLPGRLSVSRTFGDIEAKLKQFSGNPKCVVAEPEIRSFKIIADHDFLILASDGIFDKMSSNDVMRTVWEDLKSPQLSNKQPANLHCLISSAVESVLKESINRRTYDNITVVMIAFSKEEEHRPKTTQSVERSELIQRNTQSPIPVGKLPYAQISLRERDEKTNLRNIQQTMSQAPSSTPSSKPFLYNNGKNIRASYDVLEYLKHPPTHHPHQIYYKQKEIKPRTAGYDENQENTSYHSNKFNEMKKSQHPTPHDVKLSSEYSRQIKKAVPIYETVNRFPGRIY